MKGDTKKPEYLAEFPYGKIPAFKGTDGFKLTEGKAIARYGTFSCLTIAMHFSFASLPPSSFSPSSSPYRSTFRCWRSNDNPRPPFK